MSKKLILCVDDENIIIRSLKNNLENLPDHKCAIETAESGQEALEILIELLEEGHEIPVVISDYIMPGMKGDELLKRIHQLSPRTVKIMLTGRAATEGVINAVNDANLFRYVEKPWDKETLRAVVCEALDCYSRAKMQDAENKKLLDTMKCLEESLKQKDLELAGLNQEPGMAEGWSAVEKLAENLLLFKELSGFIEEMKSNQGKALDKISSNDIEKIMTTVESIRPPEFFGQAGQKEMDLRRCLEGILERLAGRGKIQREYGNVPPFKTSYEGVEHVLANLLSILLRPDGSEGEILIKTAYGEGRAGILLGCSGIGAGIRDMADLLDEDFIVNHENAETVFRLLTSRKVIREIGGNIAIESFDDKYSGFRVEIPVL